MITGIAILFLTQLLVPVLLIVWLWRFGFKSWIAWFAAVLGCGAYIVFYMLIGRWDWVGYPLRFLLPVVFLVAAFVSLRRLRVNGSDWWQNPGSFGGWTNLVASVLLALLFGISTVQVILGFSPGQERAAELSFPLEGGVSYVAHGGAIPVLNYHNVDRSQRFALDMGSLNLAGTRASGIYPSNPGRYAVFEKEITSPCAGEVIETKDGQQDHRGSGTDRENPAGNHVVVRCRNAEPAVDVLLAHMKKGSVVVEKGEDVETGKVLGRVGNSGNSSEPHLHVHAVKTGTGDVLEGEGVPVEFDGRFLVRNSLVF